MPGLMLDRRESQGAHNGAGKALDGQLSRGASIARQRLLELVKVVHVDTPLHLTVWAHSLACPHCAAKARIHIRAALVCPTW